MIKKILLPLFTLVTLHSVAQQVIPLYEQAAPGSENWTWSEQENDSNAFNTKLVYNVSKPTLTVYPADPKVPNTGTGVIICPGGGFHILAIEKEGVEVAKWLNEKGITAFVLKYRLEHSLTTDPVKEMLDKHHSGKLDMEKLPTVSMAIADGRAAIAYVRKHATEFDLMPQRIGIIGFSAGGTVAASAAFDYTALNRPDFVGTVYPYLPAGFLKTVPTDAPPLFVLGTTPDPFNKKGQNIHLYNKWLNAKKPAEMHIYEKGDHGFGMEINNIPADTWIDRFADWLNTNDLLSEAKIPKSENRKRAEDFANYFKMIDNRFRTDWPYRKRFEEDNAKLPAPTATEKRVVFMGNSITEGWLATDPDFFKGKPYINRGIGGQTTPQMLLRFRNDVINLKPAAVVILAGINDIAENTGPAKLETVFGHLVSMAELAKANGIKVIFSSVLPANRFSWQPKINPAEKVVALNNMLKAYAVKNNLGYIDYYTAMVDDRKGLPDDLATDGVHPTLKGYKIMEPLAEKAIAKALNR